MTASDLSRLTDEELLARYCATSDPSAFEQLVNLHWRQIVSWAYQVVGNNSAAEDVGQVALLQVHRACRRFGYRSKFRSWLYRIVKNAAVTYFRQRRRVANFTDLGIKPFEGRRKADPTEPIAPEHDGSSDLPDLRSAVAKLPEKSREIVALMYFHETEQSEAAALLRIPLGTVKSRLHRALHRLRLIVKTDGEFQCRAS